jgi:two-component system, LytTR family, sensor kinase
MNVKFTNFLILRHFISWVVVISLFQVITNLSYSLPIIIIRAFFELLIFAIPYYVISIIIMPIYKYKNKIKAIVYFLLLLFFFLVAYYLLEFGTSAIAEDMPLEFPEILWVMHATVYFILITILAGSFYNNQVALQKLKLVNIQEQLIIKQEILFFKNQFNHHVSFNILNYCHENFEHKFENGAKAVEIYKKMLESTLLLGSTDALSLDLEILYLEQFIHLQELVSKKVPVHIYKSGDFRSYNILPRILINYLENAYKYGITNDINKQIKISLTLQENELHFKIFNYKKKNKDSTVSTGTGQTNAKQQLDLYYQNNYTILVEENEISYQVYLKIKLEGK